RAAHIQAKVDIRMYEKIPEIRGAVICLQIFYVKIIYNVSLIKTGVCAMYNLRRSFIKKIPGYQVIRWGKCIICYIDTYVWVNTEIRRGNNLNRKLSSRISAGRACETTICTGITECL